MTGHLENSLQSRRNFLATSASGIGGLALASLLRENGLDEFGMSA